MNWFIAFPIPPIQGLAETLKGIPEHCRVIHPADLHLTLAFLGSCGETAAFRAWEFVSMLPLPSFVFEPHHLEAFGNPKRPSALGIVPRSASSVLSQFMLLYRDQLCDIAGAKRELRPPRPHVTIARPPKRATHQELDLCNKWAKQATCPSEPIFLSTLALYTWAEDRSVQQFRVIAQAPIAANGS